MAARLLRAIESVKIAQLLLENVSLVDILIERE